MVTRHVTGGADQEVMQNTEWDRKKKLGGGKKKLGGGQRRSTVVDYKLRLGRSGRNAEHQPREGGCRVDR